MFLKIIRKVIFCIFIFSIVGFSQSISQVKLKALHRKNYVILRWAPTNPTTWFLGVEHGYGIERYTMARNGKMLDKPEKIVLSRAPLKPAPQTIWENEYIKKQDDYLAIAAQAYYGTNFQVLTNKPGVMDMVNKAREQENRFGFALVAADRNGIVAQLSGLRYVDSTVKSNERYLYRVYTYIPIEKQKTDTAFTYVNMSIPNVFPRFSDFKAKANKKQVTLTWSSLAVSDYFSAYIIERSENEGKTWKQVNLKPYAYLSPNGSVPENYTYMDTIPYQGRPYWFRIAGTTIFDENGPYSPMIRVQGKNSLPESPKISTMMEIEKTGGASNLGIPR